MLFGQLFQPVAGQVDRVQHLRPGHLFQPVEGCGEGAVETVQMAFVLDHRGAGKVVEAVDVIGHQPRRNPFEEGEEFAQGNGDAFLPQRLEEGQEHRARLRPCGR